MTKIDIFSGFLGAGKTTLIKKLLSEAYAGEKVVLIENEFGEIGIDGGFLQDAGIEITEMNSGCICCSLVGDFTKALAKELGLSGISVNCVEPGVINTEMNAELDEETLKELCDETPAGKIGDVGELSDFIFDIATEKSGFLTGQIIGFDGGFAI